MRLVAGDGLGGVGVSAEAVGSVCLRWLDQSGVVHVAVGVAVVALQVEGGVLGGLVGWVGLEDVVVRAPLVWLQGGLEGLVEVVLVWVPPMLEHLVAEVEGLEAWVALEN